MDITDKAKERIDEELTAALNAEGIISDTKTISVYSVHPWTNKHGDERISVHCHIRSEKGEDDG